MTYSTWTRTLLAMALREIEDDLRGEIEPSLMQIIKTVIGFLQKRVSATQSLEFEEELQRVVRELARLVTEWTYNRVEPNDCCVLPHGVHFDGISYRRMNQKTPNRNVSTRFGKITLWRFGYRDSQRDGGEPTLFPLERTLGLIAGATPALASVTGQYFADTGATQDAVLKRLRREHGVIWGTKKLREVTGSLAEQMRPCRLRAQADKVLALLEKALNSRGNRRPVLSVGRDGITLGMKPGDSFEIASTATVTVYDRRMKRLGTVYLAQPPESGQQTMTDELTDLLQEIFSRWEGPIPRLCYVTDAGDNETAYFQNVLEPMCHPQTGKPLAWQWIVDYYHASKRITIMAEALFGKTRSAESWAKRMRKLLLKRNGPSRVLHAAASRASRHKVIAHRKRDYRRAYEYLRTRTKFMQYWEYKRNHLPIGSGVTEAACKTVFTQRLKLSGMRWKHEGAKTVLTLRVILLSGIWDDVYRAMLTSSCTTSVRTYGTLATAKAQIAA